MSITATLTFVAVLVTGITVFARSELFRPKVKSAYSTNPVVRLLMDAVSLACAFTGFELWGYRGTVPDGIVWLLVLCAVTSTAMLASMLVHDGRLIVAQVRASDIGEMRTAVEATVPPAVEAAMPQVFKDLAAQPDPYRPGRD